MTATITGNRIVTMRLVIAIVHGAFLYDILTACQHQVP